MGDAFAFKLGRTPVHVGWSAVIVYLLFGFMMAGRDVSPQGLVLVLGTAALIAGSILVHEFGHASALRRYGHRPLAVELNGFGGLCHHRARPTLSQDVVISLAGPGAGLLLGAGFYALSVMLPATTPWMLRGLVQVGVWINIVWSIFNLLPMKPLDGSHALYSGLRLKLKARRASEIARWVSIATAGAVGAWALMSGQMIVLYIAAMSLYTSFTGRRLI